MKTSIVSLSSIQRMNNWSAEVCCDDSFQKFIKLTENMSKNEMFLLSERNANILIQNELPLKVAFVKTKDLLGAIRGGIVSRGNGSWGFTLDDIKTYILKNHRDIDIQARALYCSLILLQAIYDNKESIQDFIQSEIEKVKLFQNQLDTILHIGPTF